MRRHLPQTETLYAQLLELALAGEADHVGGFARGSPVSRVVNGQTYLYWQLRDIGGKQKQVYLGPRDNPRAVVLRDALVAFKARAHDDDLEKLTAAYVASGGASNQTSHFKVVDALARAGLFRAGAVLVGSHAFVSIGAALGVTFAAQEAATADVDFCRDQFVSVACDELRRIDVPGVLRAMDPSFLLVPELDLRTPSTSLVSQRNKTKVDLLTTAKTPRDTKPRVVAPFGLGAQPLRYMDFLVRHGVQRALFIGKTSVLINVPDAARYAIHKLAISTRRHSSIKALKDVRQADAMLQVLAEVRPGSIAIAMRAARANHDKGLVRDVLAASGKLSPASRAALR